MMIENWVLAGLILIAVLQIFVWIKIYFVHKKLQHRERNVVEKVEKIIGDAEKKAADTIIQADYMAELLHKDVEAKLDQTVNHVSDDASNFFKHLVSVYQSESSTFSTQLKGKVNQELGHISQLLSQEVKRSTDLLENIFLEERKKIADEFVTYKEKKHSEYENELRKRTDEIISSLIPSQISIQDHEKLIMEALKKAENEGLFK